MFNVFGYTVSFELSVTREEQTIAIGFGHRRNYWKKREIMIGLLFIIIRLEEQ